MEMQTYLGQIVGKTVMRVTASSGDSNYYGEGVVIQFTDGTTIHIVEAMQAGQVHYEIIHRHGGV
jgi:bisphosphoglycerate-independent phosphoglycerate mutase (AlkP superfamily)